MEINITYKSPEHEAAFLSELQRIPHIMDDEMNTAEVLRDEAKENRTREILELMRNSKTLEEAVEKVKALLNK